MEGLNFHEKNADSVWNAVVECVRTSLPTELERNRWARSHPLMLTHRKVDGEYLIGVAEQIQIEMYAPYAKLIEEALQMIGQGVLSVRFVLDRSAVSSQPAPLPRPQYGQSTTDFSRPALPVSRGLASTMPLHENYTFENFVQGPSNSFAYAAASAVAKEGPGATSYNPLFIYGGTGLGKTHLMEAIGHYVMAKSPAMSVCFITSETFLNEYINAIANNAMPAFRERYRKVDLLLLDDVQFIAGTEKFQEEFFNTFNSLMLTHKQVVMTSDVAPKNLKGCEERLIGRFQQGMVVEIESPSYETRLAILKSKVATSRHLIPEDILKFIAENIRSHVRAIEGALNRVITFMNLNRDLPLTVEIAKHLLKDSIEEEQTIKHLTVDEIMKTVAAHYGVKIEEILSTVRTQTLVTPRQVAMFLSCKLTTKSLTEIGNAFAKKHATVYHGAQTIQKRLDVEDDLRKSIEEITTKLGRKLSDLGE